MDRERDQETLVCESCGRGSEPAGEPTEGDDTEQAGIRKPPLLEVVTPGGRVWYLVNLN